MTTSNLTMNESKGSSGGFVVFLIFLMAMGLFVLVYLNGLIDNTVWDYDTHNALQNVVIDPEYSHAMEEHPESALIVRKCLKDKGAYMTFQIEPNKRYLRVCIINERWGQIGFQIVDIVNRIAKERTAYIKEECTSIKDVLNYVKKNGYIRFKGPL